MIRWRACSGWRRPVWRAAGCTFAACAITATLLLAGCGGGVGSGGGGAESQPPPEAPMLPAVGPIPGAEFATVPPPTFEQVITAYRTVTSANPALLDDEPALSRALFDEVRRITTSTAEGRARALGQVMRQALFDHRARLTLEEWKLVIRRPLDSARAAPAIETSAQAAVQALPCDADIDFIDGKADALRHAYWNALMARRATPAFAELFANAHETGSTNAPAATAMDLHNNAFGRALASRLPAASDEELLQVLLQQSFTFVAAGAALPASGQGLAYIAAQARRPFDGIFAGTLTNADGAEGMGAGGEPWAVELRLSQCADIVHGNYRATRGAALVERRFSGRLQSPTSMTLDVADPLAGEPGAGPNPCLGMRAELSGNQGMWSGPWTAPGCPRGGILSVAR